MYADVDGHIGYFCNGRIPVRPGAASGLPTPGWDGGVLWERFLTIDEVPQALDPREGVVITANNRIVGDDFPHYIANDYMAGLPRAADSRELLSRDSLDTAYMRTVQMDLVSPPARGGGDACSSPVSCTVELAEAMRLRLVAWDGRMDPGRIEPTVYEAFMRRLAEHALRPLCGDAWAIAAGFDLSHPLFEYPANLTGRVTPMLLERWEAGDESLFDGLTTWNQVAEDALEDAVADLHRSVGNVRRWRWGRLHRLALRHPLAVRRLLHPLLNAPGHRGGRQRRHRHGHRVTPRRRLHHHALRAVVAAGVRRGQLGERLHRRPVPGAVRASLLAPPPRPVEAVGAQPAVPAALG